MKHETLPPPAYPNGPNADPIPNPKVILKRCPPSLKRSAQGYGREGFEIFPLHGVDAQGRCTCGNGACTSVGKHPRTKNGLNDATASGDKIEAWWTHWPDANIGLRTGTENNIFVLDVDCKMGRDGFESLKQLTKARGKLPKTTEVRTGTGRHLFFRMPKGLEVKNRTGLRAGLDVRGCKGYVVAPPSLHESGQSYAWARSMDDLCEAPEWLLELVAQSKRPTRKMPPASAPSEPASERDIRYAHGALQRALRKLYKAKEGVRNATLNSAANALFELVQGGCITQAKVWDELGKAAESTGLEPKEIERTLKSAFDAAMKRAPRRAPPITPPPADPPPGPSGEPPEQPSWRHRLIRDANGRVRKLDQNVLIALSEAPEWKGAFAHNVRKQLAIFKKRAPTGDGPGDVTDLALKRIRTWLESKLDWHPELQMLKHLVLEVADHDRFDPVEQYLEALTWDRKPRLDTWLIDFAQAQDTPYIRAVSSKWMISAVARALSPGCKVDHMLVLEGKQGAGKSSLFAKLAGDEFFSDTLPPLKAKDAHEHLSSGVWIIEFGELDALRHHEVERVKHYITVQNDRFRWTHGILTVPHPRRIVFCGTTNADEWNRDVTGGRRFWPVKVSKVDLPGLESARDQLWAEAVHRYKTGEAWHLSPELEAHARIQQEQRYEADVWEGSLAAFLEERAAKGASVQAKECLSYLGSGGTKTELDFKLPDAKRVGRCLRRLGWRYDTTVRPRLWHPPEEE